ncbi:protein GRAVITROPIC IN THE LIGHT 1-like [Forsythia ovata]|uniref:Protein GRAVITROPIC IN THE LIGHT 1-like n=1 Tax=Forsythia ovata TaxID=205694 RepID=A0ABD1WKD1_9LAMI
MKNRMLNALQIFPENSPFQDGVLEDLEIEARNGIPYWQNYLEMEPLPKISDEFIPDQKVVVIKPDRNHAPDPDAHLTQTIIHSLFAIISSFEASYLQFQSRPQSQFRLKIQNLI